MLRKFAQIENNIFSVKLLDIILPEEVLNAAQEESKSDNATSLANFDHIFLVMDPGFSDFKKLLNSVPNTEITEQHIVTLLYNQICAINFLHTLNIVHRDLKPANFLLNENCSVMICDFGLARILPKKTKN